MNISVRIFSYTRPAAFTDFDAHYIYLRYKVTSGDKGTDKQFDLKILV